MNLLRGLQVLNTRPLNQGKLWTQLIEDKGGLVTTFPLLKIAATDPLWLQSMPNLDSIDLAIFTSANAVHYLFSTFKEPWPKHLSVIAIGQGTQAALESQGIKVCMLPTEPSSEGLLSLPLLQTTENQRILLVKGLGGRDLLQTTLSAKKAQMIELSVYQRNDVRRFSKKMTEAWQNKIIDIILVTSQQALMNLFLCVKALNDLNSLQQTPCLVISERLATVAKNLGLKTIIVCKPELLIQTLDDFKQGLDA